jgi:hypothetical protein
MSNYTFANKTGHKLSGEVVKPIKDDLYFPSQKKVKEINSNINKTTCGAFGYGTIPVQNRSRPTSSTTTNSSNNSSLIRSSNPFPPSFPIDRNGEIQNGRMSRPHELIYPRVERQLYKPPSMIEGSGNSGGGGGRGGMCGNDFSNAQNVMSTVNSHNTYNTTNVSQKSNSFSLTFLFFN